MLAIPSLLRRGVERPSNHAYLWAFMEMGWRYRWIQTREETLSSSRDLLGDIRKYSLLADIPRRSVHDLSLSRVLREERMALEIIEKRFLSSWDFICLVLDDF